MSTRRRARMTPEDTTIITWLATVLVLAVFSTVILFRIEDIKDAVSTAEIAGTRVPPVSCQEDEAIWWIGVDRLGCVHFEEVN